MAEIDLRRASDYDDDAPTAPGVKSVLVEIGQVLGSYRERFAVIGGAVPWLLLTGSDMPHVGTLDVDLTLHAEALGDGDYARLVDALLRQGYRQGEDRRRFQLVRTVPARDGGPDIDVVVDFLMPRDATIAKNVPPLVADFAVQRADGADLALKSHKFVAIDGDMPGGGRNRVRIAVASIPALLAMKGYAIADRLKQKDAYDIYFSIRNFRAVSRRSSPKPSCSSSSSRQGPVIATLRRNSATRKISVRPACGSSSTGPTCSRTALPINGSRTRSGRSTPGSRRWD